MHSAPEQARLIHTARQVNDDKPRWVIEQVHKAVAELPAGRPARIAVLGLAFKPNIDDLRESPAMHIAEALKAEGHSLLLVEPHIDAAPSSLGDLALVPADQAVNDADIVLVLVAHRQFNTVRDSLSTHRCVIDAVGITSTST